MENRKNAIILLSGGLDSSTTLAIAKSEGFCCYALSFEYNQRHDVEIRYAKKIATAFGTSGHKIIRLDAGVFSNSALVDRSITVPLDRRIDAKDIPITYVPARNTVFLSYALAIAEAMNIFDIFIGVNAADYSGYPDCRPEYIEAFEKMANLATAAAVENKGQYKIHTPIIKMSKAQIIAAGTKLGVDYSLTHSCYNPDEDGRPCGRCDSCQLRLKGFREAGLKDPVIYAN